MAEVRPRAEGLPTVRQDGEPMSPPHGTGEREEIPAGACPVVWLGYWEMFAPAFLDSHPWIAEEIREQTAHMNGRGGGER